MKTIEQALRAWAKEIGMPLRSIPTPAQRIALKPDGYYTGIYNGVSSDRKRLF